MAGLGVELRIVELIINHQAPILMGYNRFAYMDEKRDALARWAAVVVPSPPPPDGDVVDLNERRQA